MDNKLPRKVIQGIKAVAEIELFLVFSVDVFHFSIVTGGIVTDELALDDQSCGSNFE